MGIRHGSKEPVLTSRQDTSQQLVVQVMRRDLSAFSAQDRGRLLDTHGPLCPSLHPLKEMLLVLETEDSTNLPSCHPV